MSKSVNCDSCKDKSWGRCGDKRLDSLFECYICRGHFKKRDFNSHMDMHYNDPNLYITCTMCKVNQHISGFKFKNFTCRLCVYVHRYRYTRTKDRFKKYAVGFNIKV